MARLEFSPCPFCLATEHGSEVVTRVSGAAGRRRTTVVALLHREGCPRRGRASTASTGSIDASMASMASMGSIEKLSEVSSSVVASDDVYRVPGEKGPPLPAPLGVVNAQELVPLTNVIATAVRKALDEAELNPDPVTLASALVGIACATAGAYDENYVPPVFLIGFLPEMGIDESVTLGMVRLAYEYHRRFAEAVVESQRLDLVMEQAVAEAEAQRKTEN